MNALMVCLYLLHRATTGPKCGRLLWLSSTEEERRGPGRSISLLHFARQSTKHRQEGINDEDQFGFLGHFYNNRKAVLGKRWQRGQSQQQQQQQQSKTIENNRWGEPIENIGQRLSPVGSGGGRGRQQSRSIIVVGVSAKLKGENTAHHHHPHQHISSSHQQSSSASPPPPPPANSSSAGDGDRENHRCRGSSSAWRGRPAREWLHSADHLHWHRHQRLCGHHCPRFSHHHG